MSVTEKRGGGRFTLRVVLPVLLAVVVTVGTVAWFVFVSTTRSDERALARETHLVSHVLDQKIAELTKQEDDNANWDDALAALKHQDVDWIDTNLGAALYEAGKFDRIYVVDPRLRPIYAMYGGGKTAPGKFEDDRAALSPMIDRLKEVDAAGGIAAYDNDNADKVPRVTDVTMIAGRPAFVGVMPILSDSGDVTVSPGSESFLVCVRYLDGALAQDLMDQYLIRGAAFGERPSNDPERASFPIRNGAGATVAYFVWQPDRPGAQFLSENLPSLLGALGVAGIVLVLLLRGLYQSTAALEAGKARAEYQATHDALTGLANRVLFNKRLEEAIAASPNATASVALLALDLDRFKQVNDTLGHDAGDQLLREVAQRLTPLVRPGDTVARLGGDEFAIIQTGITGRAEAGSLSDRVIAAISAPFVLAGKVTQIGVSIGIVIAPASQAARDLASKADIALYAAKASGRNQYKIFDDQMHAAATFRASVLDEMEAANLPSSRVA